VTPVDLSNYRFGEITSPSATAPAPVPAAPAVQAQAPAVAAPAPNPSSFYRKTPQHPMANPAPGPDTSNLDVPTFLRKQGNG